MFHEGQRYVLRKGHRNERQRSLGWPRRGCKAVLSNASWKLTTSQGFAWRGRTKTTSKRSLGVGHSSDCWKAWAAWINRLCCPSEGIHCRGSVVSPHLERHFTSTNTVVSPWRETMSSSDRLHRQFLARMRCPRRSKCATAHCSPCWPFQMRLSKTMAQGSCNRMKVAARMHRRVPGMDQRKIRSVVPTTVVPSRMSTT